MFLFAGMSSISGVLLLIWSMSQALLSYFKLCWSVLVLILSNVLGVSSSYAMLLAIERLTCMFASATFFNSDRVVFRQSCCCRC